MPRFLIAAVLAAVAASVAVAVVTTTRASSPRQDLQIRIDAADQAAARAALLRRSDLGTGWNGGPTKPDRSPTGSCAGYAPKLSDLVQTGEGAAHFQHSGSLDVTSDAVVLRTPSMFARYWRRTVADPRLDACFRSMFNRGAFRVVSFTRLAFPRLTRYVRAYRIVFAVRVQGKRIRFSGDLIFVGRGRTELTVAFTAPASVRRIVRGEAKLVKAALGRARA
jgi:hypothetical protein